MSYDIKMRTMQRYTAFI